MNAEESSSSKNIISNSKNAHIKLHKSYPTERYVLQGAAVW